jgi:hypothetical protein
MTTTYDFYVGSTETWLGTWPLDLPGVELGAVYALTGVWNGIEEWTGRYSVFLENDAQAQRVACAIANMTRNDCVLVARGVNSADNGNSLNSTREYRVNSILTYQGNRTLYDVAELSGAGWRYESDVNGEFIAFLVNNDGTIEGIK